MSTPADPSDPAARPTGGDDAPAYYRPGPSSGHYPQYPQNPYPRNAGAPGRPAPPFPPPVPAGDPFPAGTGPLTSHPGPAVRPRNMVTALVLLLVPPALFLLVGLVLTFAPLSPDMFPPEAGLDEALTASGLTMQQLLSAMRTFGAVVAVLAVVYAVLALVTFLGRFPALVVLTVLTGLFDLFWLLALVSSAANPLGAILPVIVLVTSLAGIGLMFSAPARAWFATRR